MTIEKVTRDDRERAARFAGTADTDRVRTWIETGVGDDLDANDLEPRLAREFAATRAAALSRRDKVIRESEGALKALLASEGALKALLASVAAQAKALRDEIERVEVIGWLVKGIIPGLPALYSLGPGAPGASEKRSHAHVFLDRAKAVADAREWRRQETTNEFPIEGFRVVLVPIRRKART